MKPADLLELAKIIAELQEENAELLKDKERLDWLTKKPPSFIDWVRAKLGDNLCNFYDLRQAIDVYRKEKTK